jgi:DegV family protein with EDD domain
MIQILTDSMSDVRQEDAGKYALTVLPQHVLFGVESYLDGINLSVEQFYEKLATEKELPKTSQITPEAFAKVFASVLSQGDEIVCILGSSKLSGTFQSAVIARDMQGEGAPVYVIDSLSASLGEHALVHEAVRLRDQGETAASIAEKITALVARVCIVARVKDLKHLVRGGRVSATTARIGTTLHLNPMLRMVNGRIEQEGLTRGKKRSFEWMKKQIDSATRDERYPIYFASAGAMEEIPPFREYLAGEGMLAGEVRLVEVGPVIGTHTGQGLLAVSWVRKEI